MDKRKRDQLAEGNHTLLRKLDAMGWGVFLIWIGVAFLTDMSWGIGLVGVAVIVLTGQAARWYFRLHVEWFWLAFGIVFAAWGILGLLRLEFGEAFLPGGVLPVLSILAGIALVASALLRKSHH